MEALRKTMQEGHHTIFKAVVEKKMKARVTMWKDKAPQNSSCSLQHQGVDVRLNRRF